MEDATLFATMIGVGTLFATAGFVPAVTLFIGCSIAWMVHEDVAAAYAKLVVTLGSERTDMLLEHYRMDDGYYKYY